jgi:hypothetical protein
VTVSDVEETLRVPESGRRLGLTTGETLTLAFLKELESIEAPRGRRIVPISAIERYRASHPTPA